ncbi:MAG TPA: hypothetical protein VNH80_06935 [Burkholderiales bacterium]|nr:hypothetical protein [Burkholderiales bacterium]
MRATAPLERAVKMHTSAPVDEDAYLRFMQDAALAWTPAERERLQPLLDGLEPVVARLAWKPSGRILLIKSSSSLEDGLPHTRANGIVLSEEFLAGPAPFLSLVLAHELFHVLSRDDPKLRDRLYAAIGFRPCASVEVPPAIARLRLSNPDAPLHRHSIAVRYRGRALDAMPYPRLPEDADPAAGFRTQVRAAWLLVERSGQACRALEEAQPRELDGLAEQIGRNTRYLWHPEEILADNFALLALGKTANVPSPEVLERLRPLLFQ